MDLNPSFDLIIVLDKYALHLDRVDVKRKRLRRYFKPFKDRY
tara:strand:+ start:306 stop:431 length:126 start_codon:yes stop_codon:yes gene_type:complete